MRCSLKWDDFIQEGNAGLLQYCTLWIGFSRGKEYELHSEKLNTKVDMFNTLNFKCTMTWDTLNNANQLKSPENQSRHAESIKNGRGHLILAESMLKMGEGIWFQQMHSPPSLNHWMGECHETGMGQLSTLSLKFWFPCVWTCQRMIGWSWS